VDGIKVAENQRGVENHELGISFFLHKDIFAVQGIESVNERMFNVILRVRWHDVIVLNYHAQTG
jgi:hypothetical protein